ncbi:DUF6249 domain-containing protein [Usitatibacter palustris]|uniref:DUF6249 domain-containing protein n=1 Tax=Usitatibacter palustris TaxID=2732487 RepID=A0A6M4H5C7_9PROT|nr:DUF6249 domain-containing protein [Usitatibacter palustris]QJR14869.1 hypothetical protein DSM104440_01684 [Usitatibacter palustris]
MPHETLALAGMLFSFALPVGLVGVILWYKLRRQRMIHETITRLAEKGLPVPPSLTQPPKRNASLQAGLVLIGLGIALSCLMLEVKGPWSVGLIPGLIGIAMLIAWAIDKPSGPAS